jgi:hypothetical protein
MNLVSLLIAPAVVQLSIGSDQNNPLRIGLSVPGRADHRRGDHHLEAADRGRRLGAGHHRRSEPVRAGGRSLAVAGP